MLSHRLKNKYLILLDTHYFIQVYKTSTALFTLGCPAKDLIPLDPDCKNDTGSCICVITYTDETFEVMYDGISKGSMAHVQTREDYCYNSNNIDQECNGDMWSGEIINASYIVRGDT